MNDSNRKPIQLWVGQGSEFYNKLMQEGLGKNDIWMYPKHNEGTSVIAERFINLKLMIEPELLIIRIFFVKLTLKIGQEKYLLSIPFGKLILWLI